MSRPLSNAEMVLLQAETDYLDAGIPPGGSVVTNWGGMFVLIYHSNAPGVGYFTTDVSDLPASTLAQLAKWTPAQSALFSLPGAVQETIYRDAEAAIGVVKSAGGTLAEMSEAVAGAVGQTLGNLLSPVVGALAPILIIGVGVALVYLMKKA